MIMNKILLIASAFLATIGSLTAQNSIVDSVLTIADGTTEIKSQAFYGKKDFNKVVIPSTVTKIGGLAFHNCTKLKEIESSLPGLDCGICGAPSCRALADDIVRGYAQEADCVLHNIRVGGKDDWLPAPFRVKVQSEDTGEKNED